MKNPDVRAHVLREFYDQEMRNEYHGIDSADFAKRIRVPQRQIEVALKYLVDTGLLKGTYVAGTDVPRVFGIAALGMDVVDNPSKFRDIEINQQIISVSGPVYGPITQAQQSSHVTQDWGDVTVDIDRHEGITSEERESIKRIVKDLEKLLSQDNISQSRLQEILTSLKRYNWLYPIILNIVQKILKIR